VIRRLSQAADAPKRSGSPKKSGKVSPEVIAATSGRGVIRLDGRRRNEVALTLLLAGGTSRDEVVEAFDVVLARCFPN
jgi:ParB family chromosome partitioning protein